MALLNGIQHAKSIRLSAFLINLEKELLRELDVIMGQENYLWMLKSQVNWMLPGDQNTTFYHVSTLVKRKRNQILAIKNSVGEWI